MGNRKRFLLKIYPELNFGDDLFLKIILERYPDVDFYVLCNGKFYQNFKDIYQNLKTIDVVENVNILDRFFLKASSYLNISNIEEYSYFRFLDKQYAIKEMNYDGFIVLGGSMFIEVDKHRSRRLVRFYKWLNYRFLDKFKFFLGSNFGPYYSDSFKVEFENIFKKANQVTFREKFSQDLFVNLENVEVYSDIVFGLDFVTTVKEKDTFGIVLVDPKVKGNHNVEYDKYIKSISLLLIELVKSGKIVKLFSFCEREGDVLLYKSILELVPPEVCKKINLITYEGDVKKFLEEYSSLESCLASRFHALILSAIFKQKVVPVSYSKKINNMLSDIGYSGRVLDLCDLENYTGDNIQDDLKVIDLPIDVSESAKRHFKSLEKFI